MVISGDAKFENNLSKTLGRRVLDELMNKELINNEWVKTIKLKCEEKMKKILVSLLALSSVYAHAAFITCNTDYYMDTNEHVMLSEKVTGECYVHNPIDLKEEKKIFFEIKG